MSIQRATFNGNLNPQAQPDETVLDFLQRSAIAKQNQDNQNAEQLNRNAEQGNLNAASALDLAKGNYDFDYTKQKGDIVHPMVLNGLKTAASSQTPPTPSAPQWPSENGPMQLNPTAQPQGQQPAQNLTAPLDPISTYQSDLQKSNAHAQAANAAENARLLREKNLGPALSDPDMQDMENRSTKNEQETNANVSAADKLNLDKDKMGVMAFLKPKLDKILSDHSGEMSKGDYNGMQADLLKAVPFNFLPDAKEYLTLADKQKPKTEFNINTGLQTDLRTLRSQIAPYEKPYQTIKNAYAQAKADYDNFASDPNGPQAGAHQQGIVDKYVTSSTGKSTTQEQFHEMVSKYPGLENYVNLVGDKVLVGKKMPNTMVNAMMRDMRDYAINTGENLKQVNDDVSSANADVPQIVRKAEIIPSSRLSSDSAEFVNDKYGNEVTGKVTPKPNFFNRILGTPPDEPVYRLKKGTPSPSPVVASSTPTVTPNEGALDAIYGTDDNSRALSIMQKHKKSK